ncbi:MAG: TetR/AcrR family transcriptional regulator [Burkholderiaceae bacterium]|nr:TetR/AcrR family transcriptional regulator [Burkholderiaceae bacterium]
MLDALENLFLDEGFREVTVAALAKRLRCSRRSFYELAPSKEALFLRVFDRYLKRLREAGRHGAHGLPAQEAIVAYLAPALDAARKLSTRLMGDVQSYPPARALWERHTRERMTGLQVLIDDCVRTNVFRGVDPYLVAEVMSASLRRIGEPDFLTKAGLSYRDAVQELYGLLLRGLQAR